MAVESDLRMEGSLAMRAGDEGGNFLETVSPRFSGLSFPFCCSSPVGLTHLGAFVNSGAPFASVHCCFLPGIRVDVKRFQRGFQSIFEAFLLATM